MATDIVHFHSATFQVSRSKRVVFMSQHLIMNWLMNIFPLLCYRQNASTSIEGNPMLTVPVLLVKVSEGMDFIAMVTSLLSYTNYRIWALCLHWYRY